MSPQLERAIAARRKQWVPWVLMQLLRAHQYDPSVNPAVDSPESRRLRQRHSEIVIALMRDSFSMRTIRRHRLDDPRITDEVRTLLVEAAKERQSKAWFRRPEDQRAEDRLATLIRLGPVVRSTAATNAGNESTNVPATVVCDLPALREVIRATRRHVCEHFYMREMRDPELTVRSNRRAHVFPRQVAMYIARQVIGASLQEIGRQFGGRHHTTVPHSINKIEEMRRSDEALDRTITRLMNSIASRLASDPESEVGSKLPWLRQKSLLSQPREHRT